ncbi:hypothetical protein [Xanthomonas oryzae pv. oryzae MAFF 311018]|nr:hypothetical protein [Xanthomonas oryzae pv. oryzae MAFF 311018]
MPDDGYLIRTGVATRVLIAACGSLLAARRVDRTIMRHVRHADPAGCICCAPLPVQLERDFFARNRCAQASLLSTATLGGMFHRRRRA